MTGCPRVTIASLGAIAGLLQKAHGLQSLKLHDTVLVGSVEESSRFCSAFATHPTLSNVHLQFHFRRREENGHGDIIETPQNLDFDELLVFLGRMAALKELTLKVKRIYNGNGPGSLSSASIQALCSNPNLRKLDFQPVWFDLPEDNDLHATLLQVFENPNSKLQKVMFPGSSWSAGMCQALLEILEKNNTTLQNLMGYRKGWFSIPETGADLFMSHSKEIDFYLRLNKAGRRFFEVDSLQVPRTFYPKMLANASSSPSILYYMLRTKPDLCFKVSLPGDN